jgi:hypothetical protein
LTKLGSYSLSCAQSCRTSFLQDEDDQRHLLHRKHTAAFWKLLGKIMPDYEERRAALRGFGAGVVW